MSSFFFSSSSLTGCVFLFFERRVGEKECFSLGVSENFGVLLALMASLVGIGRTFTRFVGKEDWQTWTFSMKKAPRKQTNEGFFQLHVLRKFQNLHIMIH